MRTPRKLSAALAVTAALFVATACSDSPDDKAESEPTEVTEECAIDDITVKGGFGEKPTLTLPEDCTPPTSVLTKDLVEGSGPEAAEGGTVVTNYLLEAWSTQEVLDNSFDSGMTFPVEPLGTAPVIQGWNEGLIGIQKGDRRLIVIPPDLGYGEAGQGPVGPNETLVFVVDAVEVS